MAVERKDNWTGVRDTNEFGASRYGFYNSYLYNNSAQFQSEDQIIIDFPADETIGRAARTFTLTAANPGGGANEFDISSFNSATIYQDIATKLSLLDVGFEYFRAINFVPVNMSNSVYMWGGINFEFNGKCTLNINNPFVAPMAGVPRWKKQADIDGIGSTGLQDEVIGDRIYPSTRRRQFKPVFRLAILNSPYSVEALGVQDEVDQDVGINPAEVTSSLIGTRVLFGNRLAVISAVVDSTSFTLRWTNDGQVYTEVINVGGGPSQSRVPILLLNE